MINTPERSLFWRIVQVPSRIFFTLFSDLKVYGAENIPREGGALLLSSHQSFFDPVLIGVKLKRPVSYMAKTDLFEDNRFFTWLIRSLHAFPIRRGTADVAALKQAISRLQEGNLLTVFPEGTRTRTGQIGKILPGVIVVIRRAGVPVIPVVIDGAFESWPRWRKLPKPFRIRIAYGPPMNFDGLNPDEIVALMGNTLQSMLDDLRKKSQRTVPKSISTMAV
ncbi:MAG TPA: lysophospholipid acyltransferase family protein [Tepidisphaeraceae bacterium]|nr:lysophospholipid acyltransferase family protein [Tepidisphaeraceae bacterium]